MTTGVQISIKRVTVHWRRLTGGAIVRDDDRPTLIALSGGVDSSALAIALAKRQSARLVAAHICHGMRPDAEQHRDRDASAELARRLDIPFVTRDILLPSQGNREALARRYRYRALADLAQEASCRFVATGHHAEDQLESMLMALLRGAGPSGLAGMKPTRPLSEKVTLIRPTLTSTRADLAAICRSADWLPVHDATNDDLTRRRAWLRRRVIPELLEHTDADLPARLASTSGLLSDAQGLVHAAAQSLTAGALRQGDRIELTIAPLVDQPGVVLGAVLRGLACEIMGETHRDALGWKRLAPIITRIRSRGMHAKTFELRGLRIHVTSQSLVIESLAADKPPGV